MHSVSTILMHISWRVAVGLALDASLAAAQVADPLKADPRNNEYREELAHADTALQERDYQAARRHYARASELAQDRSMEALCGLAWADLRLEDVKSALQDAHAALLLAASDTERGEVHNLMG